MDIFSKSKPDLVNHKTIRQISKIFQTTGKQEPSWKDNMSHFYVNYIQPNLFPLIVILLVIIFLSIRYLLKQEYERERNEYEDEPVNKKHKSKRKKPKNYKIEYDEQPVTYLNVPEQVFNMPNEDIEEERDDGEKSIYTLEQEYRASLEQNRDLMSDHMIKELYETRGSKMSFDELARVVSGQD